MERYFQAAAGILLAVILILAIQKQSREISVLLSLFVCCAVGCLAAGYIAPVIDFVKELQRIGGLNTQMLQILLKVVGIAFTSEIAGLICEDSGNAAMGKVLQFLASAVILYLSLPMLTALLKLVEEILGNL